MFSSLISRFTRSKAQEIVSTEIRTMSLAEGLYDLGKGFLCTFGVRVCPEVLDRTERDDTTGPVSAIDLRSMIMSRPSMNGIADITRILLPPKALAFYSHVF